MGKKPLALLGGVMAAAWLLTGCETSGSKKAVAQTPPPVRPTASANGATPMSNRPATAWDNTRNGPPPNTLYTPGSGNNVAPAGYTVSGSAAAGAPATSGKEATPVNNSRDNTAATLGTPNAVTPPSLTDRPAAAARAAEPPANVPPPADPTLTDMKPLTPPPPPSLDGGSGKSLEPPTLPTPQLKPPMP